VTDVLGSAFSGASAATLPSGVSNTAIVPLTNISSSVDCPSYGTIPSYIDIPQEHHKEEEFNGTVTFCSNV